MPGVWGDIAIFNLRNGRALTVISFSDDVPEAPQRQIDVRNLSILKSAILRTALGEELCLVGTISRAGLMAHVFSDLEVGDAVKIVFRSALVVRGRVVWRRPGLMGVRFSQSIDVAHVLGEPPAPPHHTPREPRVSVNAPARLRSGARYQAAAIANISQGGARIHLSDPNRVGDEVALSVSGLPVLTGTVRWRADSCVGVAFTDLLSFDDVGRWISSHIAVGSAGPWD